MQVTNVSSTSRTGARILRALDVCSDLALWLSYGGTAKLAWNWWQHVESPLWLVVGAGATMLGVGLLKTVAMYWNTRPAFALLTLGMGALESVAMYELISVPLNDPWAVDMSGHLTWACLGWVTLWVWWSCAMNVLRSRRGDKRAD